MVIDIAFLVLLTIILLVVFFTERYKEVKSDRTTKKPSPPKSLQQNSASSPTSGRQTLEEKEAEDPFPNTINDLSIQGDRIRDQTSYGTLWNIINAREKRILDIGFERGKRTEGLPLNTTAFIYPDFTSVLPGPIDLDGNKLKKDYISFCKVIKDYKIKYLYHFTDRKNLVSIKEKNGLYSWQYSLNQGVVIPIPGGNQWSRDLDNRYGLGNYVRLSFTPKHPMMYALKKEGRLEEPVVLRICPSVICWESTMFSDMNATSSAHSHGNTFEDFKKVRFDIVFTPKYFDISAEEKSFYQAEVMVEEQIPLKYIVNFQEVYR